MLASVRLPCKDLAECLRPRTPATASLLRYGAFDSPATKDSLCSKEPDRTVQTFRGGCSRISLPATVPEAKEHTTGQQSTPMTTIRKQLAATGTTIRPDRKAACWALQHGNSYSPVNSAGHPLGTLCLPDADIFCGKRAQHRR